MNRLALFRYNDTYCTTRVMSICWHIMVSRMHSLGSYPSVEYQAEIKLDVYGYILYLCWEILIFCFVHWFQFSRIEIIILSSECFSKSFVIKLAMFCWHHWMNLYFERCIGEPACNNHFNEYRPFSTIFWIMYRGFPYSANYSMPSCPQPCLMLGGCKLDHVGICPIFFKYIYDAVIFLITVGSMS